MMKRQLSSILLFLTTLILSAPMCFAAESVFHEVKDWTAPRQEEAKKFTAEVLPQVNEVLQETVHERRRRLGDKKIGLKDMTRKYFLLNNPLINKTDDQYGPVRFMHAKHAQLIDNCFECHHHRPEDLKTPEIVRCSACHQQSFVVDLPGRIGLKAAYHRKCIQCHKEENKGPVTCTGCHAEHVVSHKDLLKIEEDPDPDEVTADCLRCHDDAANDMLHTAHWLWKGPTPFLEGRETETETGKGTNLINNYCIHIASNYRQCTSCHAGYGWVDNSFDFSDKNNMDCLVCHDTTNTYLKGQSLAGYPDEDVDLLYVAQNVGKSNRKTCGDCHFSGGGGDNVKHGDLSSALYYPEEQMDVHMGGYDFVCADCHQVDKHKISGLSLLSPVTEGRTTCNDCHLPDPHQGGTLFDAHLNTHRNSLSCTTCHIPVFASKIETKTLWDWSQTGDKKREITKSKAGRKEYSLSKGKFKWSAGEKPEYAWFNGRATRYLLGDKINPDGVTNMGSPEGDITDSKSKIAPFKVHVGVQPADAINNYLLVGHIYGPGGYILTEDWDKSFVSGMAEAGMAYSGEYKWVPTVQYISLNHQIPPKELALSCGQCHESLAKGEGCATCHQEQKEHNFKELVLNNIEKKRQYFKDHDLPNLADRTDYMDFKKLGYKDDPVKTGGRFKKAPLIYKK